MKKFLFPLAGLCLLASVGMYQVGSSSSHLTELKDLFWMPLPLGLAAALAGLRARRQ
jgi:hypothetical protein